jgi:hypothetical protein
MEKLLFMWLKMIKRFERLKNTVNKYMADIRPDRLTTSVRTEVGRKLTTKYIFQPNVKVERLATLLLIYFLFRRSRTQISPWAQTILNEGPRHSSGGFFFNSGLRGYWHCGHSWPIVPASGDSEDDCGEADGM